MQTMAPPVGRCERCVRYELLWRDTKPPRAIRARGRSRPVRRRGHAVRRTPCDGAGSRGRYANATAIHASNAAQRRWEG